MNSLSKHHFNYVLVLAGCTSDLRPLGLTFTDLYKPEMKLGDAFIRSRKK